MSNQVLDSILFSIISPLGLSKPVLELSGFMIQWVMLETLTADPGRLNQLYELPEVLFGNNVFQHDCMVLP